MQDSTETKKKRSEYYKQYRIDNAAKEKARSKSWYDRQDKKALYLKRKARAEAKGYWKYYVTPERCFKMYQRNCKTRKTQFNISYEEFITFWQKPCFYCLTLVETIGLDRIQATAPYTIDNIVSCCSMCNFMKHTYSQEDFINQCHKIARNHAVRDISGNDTDV